VDFCVLSCISWSCRWILHNCHVLHRRFDSHSLRDSLCSVTQMQRDLSRGQMLTLFIHCGCTQGKTGPFPVHGQNNCRVTFIPRRCKSKVSWEVVILEAAIIRLVNGSLYTRSQVNLEKFQVKNFFSYLRTLNTSHTRYGKPNVAIFNSFNFIYSTFHWTFNYSFYIQFFIYPFNYLFNI